MRYFIYTIRTVGNTKLLHRQIRRASHNVFELVVATHEVKPHMHCHMLCGTIQAMPPIEKFLAMLPDRKPWAARYQGDPRYFFNYITAQSYYESKQCGTEYVLLKGDITHLLTRKSV